MAQRNKPKHAKTLADDRILTPQELLNLIPLDRSTIYRMVQAGTFPPPLQLTTTRIGWRLSSILKWLDERQTGHITTGNLAGRDTDKPTEAA